MPGKQKRGAANANNEAARKGAEAQAELKAAGLYEGTIVDTDPENRTYTVQVTGRDEPLVNCIWTSPIFSRLLGMQINFRPPRGSNVLVLPGNPSFIVGMIPSNVPDSAGSDSRTLTASGKKISGLKSYTKSAQAGDVPVAPGMTAPNDLFEGELEIGNNMGVAMAFLTHVIRMSAGDRAKVECCLLNDMVRIVSETFRHYSAFGNFEIYNDGRLNSRIDGTSYEHEAWGRMSADEAKVKVKGNMVDFSDVDQMGDTGRWRFSEYIGFLGDFVHQVITDPTTTVGKFASDAARAGKSRVHLNADGTILFQSVAEIVFERVVRVVVPTETKRFDDPTGAKKKDFDSLDASFLKIWQYGTDPKDLPKTCFQLREYARWLSGFHSYARFHQLAAKGDWKVDSEAAAPEPEWTCKEKDKENAASGAPKNYDTYSTFRIMRDGSQVHLDGYGNATVTSAFGIQHSSARHIELQAAGDISLVAGQNIWLKARRSIDIVAVVGGIKIKARTWLHGLCEWGSIWLKSDAVDPEKEDPPKPADEKQDPEPEVLDRAIVIEAIKGQTLIQSERQILINTTGVPKDDEDDKASVVIQSERADIDFRAFRDATFSTKTGFIKFKAAKDVLVSARKYLMELAGSFDINGKMTFLGTILNLNVLRANVIVAMTNIAGPERPGPSPGGKPHYNHISKLSDKETGPKYEENRDDVTKLKAATIEPAKAFPKEAPIWDFLEPDDYRWDTERDFYESLAQQRVRTDTVMAEFYDTWSEDTNQLKTAKRTGTKYPWPGKGMQHFVHTGGEDLHKTSSKAYGGLPNKPESFDKKDPAFRFLKKQ